MSLVLTDIANMEGHAKRTHMSLDNLDSYLSGMGRFGAQVESTKRSRSAGCLSRKWLQVERAGSDCANVLPPTRTTPRGRLWKWTSAQRLL